MLTQNFEQSPINVLTSYDLVIQNIVEYECSNINCLFANIAVSLNYRNKYCILKDETIMNFLNTIAASETQPTTTSGSGL